MRIDHAEEEGIVKTWYRNHDERGGRRETMMYIGVYRRGSRRSPSIKSRKQCDLMPRLHLFELSNSNNISVTSSAVPSPVYDTLVAAHFSPRLVTPSPDTRNQTNPSLVWHRLSALHSVRSKIVSVPPPRFL